MQRMNTPERRTDFVLRLAYERLELEKLERTIAECQHADIKSALELIADRRRGNIQSLEAMFKRVTTRV
jgi:hypothetical protein